MRETWELPAVIDPAKKIYVCIAIPDEANHRRAFSGALLQLGYWFNWQDDPEHKAVEVANVWQKIYFDTMNQVDARQTECPGEIQKPFTIIPEMELDMTICEQLRWHEGRLQGMCCGEWTDIPGLAPGTVIGGSQQPSDSAEQPTAGGGCQTYHAHFPANQTWQVPTLVSAGDVVSITNPDGAGADGSIFGFYYCYDGRTRIAGGCFFPNNPAKIGDPLMTANHMALIASINSVWYDLTTGPITVPGGVANAQVIVQVNDSNITDNSGDYSVDIEVCNNSVATWCHYFDFTAAPYDWTVFVPAGQLSGSSGHWVAGTGFVSDDSEQGTPGDWFRRVYIELNGLDPSTVTAMELHGDLTKGVYGNPADDAVGLFVNVSGTYTAYVELASTAVISGAGQVWSGALTTAAVTGVLAGLTTGETNPGNTLTGSAIIKGVKVFGTGDNPFGTDNC